MSFDAAGGSIAERGIGIYVCPGPSPSGPFVYDLDQVITLSVSELKTDVSPFVGLALRSSVSTRRYFMPKDDVREWACASFGTPRTLGNGLGLATAAWLGHRGVMPRYVDDPGADIAPCTTHLPTCRRSPTLVLLLCCPASRISLTTTIRRTKRWSAEALWESIGPPRPGGMSPRRR